MMRQAPTRTPGGKAGTANSPFFGILIHTPFCRLPDVGQLAGWLQLARGLELGLAQRRAGRMILIVILQA